MPSLPKRPGPYVVVLLLAVILVLTLWMLKVLNDPAIREAVREKQKTTLPPAVPAASIPPVQLPKVEPAPALQTDATVLAQHHEMISPDTSPERELEILQDLISQHHRALGDGSMGDNGDVVSALVGQQGPGTWLPRSSPRLRGGQLMDRWGSPYWFHPNAANQMEIRSAGPDRSLFTGDDIILNGSPAGFGATPAGALGAQ